MRGFTSLAERLPPTEIMQRLNRFYSLASNTIFDYDGTLDKLVGDQVMAFFGAPLQTQDHPERAVQAALRIVGEMNGVADDEPLAVGAGIATGEAFVGNVGEGAVTDYTVLGDTVNIAARLQGAAASGEISGNGRNLSPRRVEISQCSLSRAGAQGQERAGACPSDCRSCLKSDETRGRSACPGAAQSSEKSLPITGP